MTATKCFIDNFLVCSGWHAGLRNAFEEWIVDCYSNSPGNIFIWIANFYRLCFAYSFSCDTLSTRNKKAIDFKMEVFSSSFALVAFKEGLFKWKIIPWINVQVLSGDGYQLSTVTGIRFCETKFQTLQESRNLSTGFRRLRVLNFKVTVIVFLKPHL